MKKIISIMFSVLLALSVSITAFATEDTATPDSVDFELQIKQDANEYFYDGNANVDEINVVYYGSLSDGSPIVNIYRYGGAPTVTFSYILGSYEYYCHAGDEAYIYKDNTFYFIVDAYESGLINDDTLDELYNCSVEYMKNPINNSYFLLYSLEVDFELQIKQDANEYFYDGSQELDNINITYYGYLSDGSLIVNVDREDAGHPTVSFTHTIGDYYYMYTAGQEAYIYKNNTFTFIEDAYANGLINDDDTLIEIAECSKQYLENPYDVNYYFVFVPIEVETTTQPVETTAQPTDATNPDATSSTEAPKAEPTTATTETKPASTSDTATANSSNKAVQTGQSSFAILTTLFVIALSGAVVIFAKHRYNK